MEAIIQKAHTLNDDKRMLTSELQVIAEQFNKYYEGGNTLEIGAYKGMTSYVILALMAQYEKRKGKHHIIDLFEVVGDTEWHYEEHPQELLLKNVEPYQDLVVLHKGDSNSEAGKKFISKRKYDFVFIDGDHRYPYVLNELLMVDDLAKNITVHDYGHQGVTQSVDEFLKIKGYTLRGLLDNTGLYEIVR